ncbi:MAG: VCBS repeat-containing protein [Bacteroidota bacterium]|nr:VCBS repeat-containing protein [Bacteroidota bacterium]
MNTVKKWIVSFCFCAIAFSCKRSDKVFTALSSSQTNINFQNTLEKREGFGILYYLYYYNGGGVATGDINNDGLPDIYFTANSKGHNKLYINKGNFQFEDVTDKAGVAGSSDWCTGATMADVNGDGLLDIYVSSVNNAFGLKGHNELFINNGNGTFTESSKKYGLDFSGFTVQSVFFDYDHDGDLDCFILNESQQPYQNIVDTSHRRGFDKNAGDYLLRNDVSTTGKFTDVSKEAGISQSSLGYGLGLAVADINNDGWDDIYIGNDFHENDYCYINNGNGTFTDEGAQHFNHYSRFSMGNDIADFNNDGQLDILTVDMLPPDEKTLKTYGSDEHNDIYDFKITHNGYQPQFSRNCLHRNNGNGKTFSDIGLIAGVSATDWSWCPLMADFDNDGNKDIFISSGIVKRPVDLDYVRFVSDLAAKVNRNSSTQYDDMTVEKMPEGSSYCYMFKGNGQGNFSDIGKDWGITDKKGFYNGAAYVDLDNDGNLDIVVNTLNAKSFIYKNNTKGTNHLTIAFKGEGFNKTGIGTKAYVFSKGKMQYEEMMLTRGFQSSSDPRLHFGLGQVTSIDSILIVWPDQKYQVLKNIPANQMITVEQKNAMSGFNYKTFFPPAQPELENITDNIECNWKHKENNFNDFDVQYLIPHKESTRGPKVAVGDVNKDGLEDFYVCGAKGQPGALMIQQPNGSFKSSDTTLFNKFAVCEDVDAAFFDANGDGALDLWVVSGGNEMPANGIANADRLYMNDGKGHFALAADAFQQEYENKSCIAVADIDHDGDLDVFIGHLSDQQKFGIPQSSYLYINDGKGKFSIAPNSTMNILNIGFVTAASFTDLNKDGWPDLIVAGEWMPVKIYMNNKGKFSETDIPSSTGLWQSAFVADVNNDGNPDILCGNWGHNSKLWAGKNGPVKLYVKDFDNNGIIEQVMTYTIDGNEYTFLPKDELEQALPVLRKAYVTYREVAGKTVQYLFYDLFKDYTELKAETLGSACFINDGKGNFTKQELPFDLQLSPILSFQKFKNENRYIAGGNFFDVPPYEGFYDAASLSVFDISSKKDNTAVTHTSLIDIKGQVRDLKWIHTVKYGDVLIAAKNNSRIEFYKPVK